MRRTTTRAWHRASVDAVRQEAGVSEQDDTCPNGNRHCPGPNANVAVAPCAECFFEGASGGDEADV